MVLEGSGEEKSQPQTLGNLGIDGGILATSLAGFGPDARGRRRRFQGPMISARILIKGLGISKMAPIWESYRKVRRRQCGSFARAFYLWADWGPFGADFGS
ncbi:hypothetical protein GX51_02857 [Blastomyces parvus]|uniref:Uncharacterized protein n=1 Tax=Blastomyces parvus TaxID=2060905 RepID=A0A2B7X9D9_9EURO|nr:hypothetical protein GX51_02857 [Blastomyces parvus]